MSFASKNRDWCSRRGQLQAMEPIVIMIIIAIIIGIVLIFYFRMTKLDSAMDFERIKSQEDVVSLIKISRMPELLCPKSESGDTNCIDIEKARAFSAMMNEQRHKIYYNPIFGNSNVTMFWIDENMRLQQMNLYSGIYNSSSKSISSSITYFTVYDPASSSRDFAWVVVQKEVAS